MVGSPLASDSEITLASFLTTVFVLKKKLVFKVMFKLL